MKRTSLIHEWLTPSLPWHNNATGAAPEDVASAVTSTDEHLSGPELYHEPTAQQRLDELIRLRPHQTDPDDHACAERINRLQETIRSENEDEQSRERNQGRLGSIPSVHSDQSSISGIAIFTDDTLQISTHALRRGSSEHRMKEQNGNDGW